MPGASESIRPASASRPDVVAEIDRDEKRELHAFDAKLKVDGPATIDASDTDDAADTDPLTFKKDDVAKMHAYRDASCPCEALASSIQGTSLASSLR